MFFTALRQSLRAVAVVGAIVSLASLSASGQGAPLGQFDGHGDVGAPKIAGSAVVQRRLAGILPFCRRREHVGAERRVPVRLEAHDRRFHPAGARRAPRQGRRSPSQGRPDGAPQPGRRRSVCGRRGPRRRPHLAAVPAHQRRNHRTGRVGRQRRGRHPDRAEGPDLHLLGGEVRRAVHDLRGLERQPRRRGPRRARALLAQSAT